MTEKITQLRQDPTVTEPAKLYKVEAIVNENTLYLLQLGDHPGMLPIIYYEVNQDQGE